MYWHGWYHCPCPWMCDIVKSVLSCPQVERGRASVDLGETGSQRPAHVSAVARLRAPPFHFQKASARAPKSQSHVQKFPENAFSSGPNISPLISTAFHEVSVYPKKELPFFILFTAGLCSFTAMLALLTHQFPELMGVFAKAVSICPEGDLREEAREAQRNRACQEKWIFPFWSCAVSFSSSVESKGWRSSEEV